MNIQKQLQVNEIQRKLAEESEKTRKQEMAANWQLASETKEVPKRWASTEFDNL